MPGFWIISPLSIVLAAAPFHTWELTGVPIPTHYTVMFPPLEEVDDGSPTVQPGSSWAFREWPRLPPPHVIATVHLRCER